MSKSETKILKRFCVQQLLRQEKEKKEKTRLLSAIKEKLMVNPSQGGAGGGGEGGESSC